MPEASPERFTRELGTTADASSSQAPGADFPPNLWTWRDLLLFLVFAPVAMLTAEFVALAAYTVLKPWLGWRLPSQALLGNTFFLLALQSIFYGLILGYVYLLVVVNHCQPFWKALRWRRPSAGQTLGCLLGGILMTLVVRFAPPLLPEAEHFPLERLLSSAAAAYALGAFAILVAPFMEELIFRGVLFAIFERQVGLRFAVVSTALLFAGLHVPEYWQAWNHVLMLLVVGVVFSLARGVTGSLAPSVLLHLGYNASMMAGLYFQTQHFRTLHALLWSVSQHSP
jgi:membrane protease YdiL (CAAX protease family)